ncbi:hypothetical protein GJAV_G00061010 [Gymnothorax javanicus]|nr:hypothetical protein GJAV_G00061010 [Gymnothorax javanicus]
MDYSEIPTGFRHRKLQPRARMRNSVAESGDVAQLFEDTSAGAQSPSYGSHGAAGLGYPAQTLLSDPVSNLAMAYGSSLASQGKEMVDKNFDRFVPISKLKYYFAVDTVYVGKKLGLLVFPYMHQVIQLAYRLFHSC